MTDLRQTIRSALLGTIVVLWSVCVGSAIFCSEESAAQDAAVESKQRIFEMNPFDRITLSQDQGGATFRVRPLAFPNRTVPTDPPPTDRLTVELIEPDAKAQILWRDIAQVELFEQMVLAEAESLTAQKKFDQAYDYYEFLHERYPKLPGLEDATGKYLYLNAGALYQQGDYRQALALLRELHARDPGYNGLQAALDNVTDRLMSGYLQAEQYEAARRLLELTSQRGGDDDPTAAAWREKLQAAAAAQLEAARLGISQQNYRQARDAAQKARDIWPTINGAAELKAEIDRLYPLVIVAASQLSPVETTSVRLHPALVRRQTLTTRPLVRLTGYTSRGPVYQSAWGEMKLASDRQSVEFHLDQIASGLPQRTGYDLAAFITAAASDASSGSSLNPASIVRSVDVQRVLTARLEFTRGHASPLSLLAQLQPAGDFSGVDSDSAYRTVKQGQELRFVASDQAEDSSDILPQEIVEVTSQDPQAAVDALRRGRVDLLSRVPPALAGLLAESDHVELRHYALPSVHVLIPNLQRPYPANRTFRRAVAYVMDRQGILQRELLGGTSSPRSQTISGPFPTSTNADDFWSCAYDADIPPLAYEPAMGITLLRVAEDELARAASDANRPPPPVTVVIGHEDDWLHRQAVQAIVQRLKRLGVAAERVQLASPEDLTQCDFYYAELLMDEPIIDIGYLLGHGDLAVSSGYLALALRDLQAATNWRDAGDLLHKIHAAIHAEQTVIPLWQLADQFAFRKDISGIPQRPLTLYQDVQQWRISNQPTQRVTP